MDGVLQGIRVIELATWAAAPSACAILADWGCEVTKIEHPQGGDAMRGHTTIENIDLGNNNLWFHQANRGKKSVAVDLGIEEGRQVIYRLVSNSDVFVSNFPPDAIRKFKVDYGTLQEVNPRLIYAHFSGYGEEGPDKDKPGFDHIAFWARSGIMDRMRLGMEPQFARPASGDNISALGFAGAIAAALFCRERTGKGQQVSTSLFASGTWALNWDILIALNLGKEIDRTERRTIKNPLRGMYETKDHKWLHFMMPQLGRFWSPFCKAIGREDLEDAIGKKGRSEIVSVIDNVIASKPYSDWQRILDQYGLIYDVIQSPLDVINDPQAWANGFFKVIDIPNQHQMKLVASPFLFSNCPVQIQSPAPEFGEHTEEVLLGLGYTWDDLVLFKEKGVIP